MARKAKLGKHMRWTPSGNISLQFTVDGERVSQRAILPDEPASYSTVADAQEGVKNVLKHLSLEVDRQATVRGFYARWTDVDDKQWGAYGTECPNRSEHAIYTYASALRPFVKVYGDRAIASLTDTDIRAYTQSPVYAPSHMTRIHTFLDGRRGGRAARRLKPCGQVRPQRRGVPARRARAQRGQPAQAA
jgi:hypothetical protein